MTYRYLTVLLLFFATLRADARAIRSWSYSELAELADLIVIVEPISVENTNDSYPGDLYGMTLAHFAGRNTKFKIHHAFKGSVSSDHELTILHFVYSKDSPKMRINGARFEYFVSGPLQFKKQILKDEKVVGGITMYSQRPEWLAFLKKRKDGRYEPVTDPYDAKDSFRELHEGSFYEN